MKYIANGPNTGGGAGGAAIQGSGTYTQNTGTVQFSNANGVTFGLTNGVMTASIPAIGGAQTGMSGISAGTTQMTSGTAVFSNANGISFGVNGNTITASYNSTQFQTTGNYLTTAMVSNAGSNFLGTNSAITANGVSATMNSSGVSLNFPAFLTTAQPVGAYLTTAALSQDSSKYAGINGAITGGSITVNTSGVSINLPAYLTTAQPVGAYLTTARASNDAIGLNTAVSNATITANSSGLSFDGRGYAGTGFTGTNASATFNSNGLQLSVNAGGGVGGVAFSASASSMSSGTITFSNSNGVFFGLSNGVLTASASTAPAGSLFFGSSNGVTFGTSVVGASTTVTASINGGAGGAALKGSGTYTQNSGTVEFANSNGITFGLSNNGTMTASHNGLTTQTVQPVAISGSNGSFAFSTVSFGNLNGASFYTSNGSVVASYTVPSTAGLLSAINISGGTTSNNLSAITFSNSNGVSFGLNGSVMTATVATNYQSAGAYLTTAAQSNQVVNSLNGSTGQISLNVGSSLSASTNGSSITFGLASNITTALQSAGAYLTTAMQSNAVTLSNIRVSGGTTSNLLSAITFSNSNGVSFGLNAGTMTASHNGLTTARASNDAVGLNTALTAGPLAWTVNSSGISLNAGGAAGTTSGFGGNLISGSMTHNTAGLNLSLNHPAWLTTAMQSNAATISNINISAGTTSSNLSAFNFVNSNGVSWSLDTASKVYATVATNYQSQGAYLTTARASTDAIGLNTAVSNATITANSSGFSFDGRGYVGTATAFSGTNVSATMTHNSAGFSLQLSAPAAGGGAGVAVSAGGSNFTSGTVTFGNTNGVSFITTNGSVALSFSTAPAGSLFFGSSNGVTFGTSVVGASTTVTASVAAGAGAAVKGSGTYTQNSGTIEFGNSNGITFGLSNNGTMTASHNGLTTAMASDAGSQWIYSSAAKNLTNISATFGSNAVSFSVGNYITTAMLSNAATISNINVSGGTTSSNMSALNFVNSNGVSWSLDTASKIYATVATNYQSQGAYLTTARASNDAIGLNSAITANGVSMTANSSGLSLNFPAFLTTAMQSASSSNFAGVGSAITNGTMTYGTGGLSLNLSNHLTTAMASNAGSNFVAATAAFNGTNASGTIASNGISISVAAPGGGAAQTFSVSNGTISGNPITFGNLNGLSFYSSNGSIVGSYTDGGGAGGGIAISASNSAFTSGTVSFNQSGALTIGTGAQAINFSVPATSSIVGVGNVLISTAGSTISISGGGFPQRWEQIPAFRFSLSNLTNITAISNVPFFQPFKFHGDMTLSRINFEMSRSTSGSNAFTVTAGIYGYSNETAISLIGSATGSFSNTATASVSGIRRFGLGGFGVSTFTAGGYVIGLQFNAGTNTASMNYSIRGHSGAVQAGALLPGADSYNTATNYNIFPFLGRYSTTVAFPTSVAESAVRGQFSGASSPINAWIGFNND